MSSSDLPLADIAEAVKHSLDELGVRDAAGVREFFAQIERQLREDTAPIKDGSADASAVEAVRVRWLGRKQGILRAVAENWLRPAAPDLKREIGERLNALRREAEERIAGMPVGLQVQAADKIEWADAGTLSMGVDITLPGNRRAIGARHPLRIVTDDIVEIFSSLGYSVEEGPEIETTYYNFEALNIPEDHPSRDDQDTFYIDPQTVLRTHTSPVQIRTMERMRPPVRIIVPGKAYRHDAPDATHSSMFHQVEGLAVDTSISFADLKGTLDYFMKAFFGPEVRTRLRPSFFPFTEPSAEVDISCLFCGGVSGCRVCKQSGWIELGGCGMVDPAVYSYVGYDAAKYSGFAFGMGLERLAMLKYGVPDIQLFYQGDVRFLHQFR